MRPSHRRAQSQAQAGAQKLQHFLQTSDPSVRAAYNAAITKAVSAATTDLKAKHKTFLEAMPKPLDATTVSIQGDRGRLKRVTNRDAVILLSKNNKVGQTYQEISVRALQMYKKDLKGQFKAKLDEIEKESREYLRQHGGSIEE